MKAENKVIGLNTYKIVQDGSQQVLTTTRSLQTYKISSEQIEYLEALNAGKTIAEMIAGRVEVGQPVSFRELFALVQALIKLDIPRDSTLKDSFSHQATTELSVITADSSSTSGRWNADSLRNLPFFRNMSDEHLRLLIQQCEIIKAPERTLIIKTGSTDRDLYALFEGEASIYRAVGQNKRKLITTIPAGSIFGEGAFFLNRARSADVITNQASVLGKITFSDKLFASLISATEVSYTQERLWILHGLLSSPIFQHVPAETLDRFVTLGKSKTIANQETICKQGEQGENTFFVVIQGEFNVIHNKRLLKPLKQGDIFGEIALLFTKGERLATIEARGEGLILEITQKEFFNALAENLLLARSIEVVAARRYNDIMKDFSAVLKKL
jgi:CRP-like cAMP-binding protein